MGEGLGLLLVVGGVAGVSLLLSWIERARLARARARVTRSPSPEPWAVLARRVGLLQVETASGGLFPTSWVARAGKLRVGLRRAAVQRKVHTQIVVSGFSPHPPGLSVEPRGEARQLASRLFGREIEIGAPDFDAAFSISGDALHAQAVLGARTRAKLSAVLQGTYLGAGRDYLPTQATLRGGELRLRIEEPVDLHPDAAIRKIEGVLRHALNLARRLEMPADVAARLAGHLGVDRRRVETHEGARAKSLSFLIREFPQHPATARALAAARQDASPRVRLEGALGEGERGRGRLLEMAEDPEMPEAVAARAVEALGEALPFATVKSLLDRALEKGQDELAGAARRVLAAIHARLHGTEGGQLSLAGSEAGALTLVTEDEPGRVSLTGAGERDAQAARRVAGLGEVE